MKKKQKQACKEAEHGWIEVGHLDEDAQGDPDDMFKFYDGTIVIEKCTVCGKERAIDEMTGEDITNKLGPGLIIEATKSHPDYQGGSEKE